MDFQQIKSRLLPALLLTLLASCSTQKVPDATTDTNVDTGLEEVTIDASGLSAEQHLALIQDLAPDLAVDQLIIATTLFFQQENYPKALWLADKTLPLIDVSTPNHNQVKMQLTLIKADSLQQLGFFQECYLQLNQLEQFANENAISLSAKYYRLLSIALQEKQQPIAALNAQLYEFQITDKKAQSQQQVENIWQGLQRLSQWQLALAALDKAPLSEGWLKLTAIANKYGDKPEKIHSQLAIWQSNYQYHPANIIAKQLASQVLVVKKIENIAVILPLSGKQYSAGLAIQQGILASFANDESKKIHFINSNTVNWYGLSNELSTLEIDYVIGPLLKSNVDRYIKYTSVQAQSQNDFMLDTTAQSFTLNQSKNLVDSETPNLEGSFDYLPAIDSDSAIQSYLQPMDNAKTLSTLLLNMPTTALLAEQHTVFSMRPEDEAKQAAATLSRQNYQHPIVLSQKNIVSKRIARAFVKQWHRITGDTIEVVYYDTGAQMQANIKASLSVDKSMARISKLKSRLNQSIKSQTRNRRDIDMIYLVGSPQKTRLVKPYIEVNISPFADTIPVYASSRSHSTKSDYSSGSDLQGLTFTEIPWLLTSDQNADLANLSQALWPNRSDGLSRLFAMGFDSYQLIDKIPLMKQAPYLQHWGQTGVLKLNKSNVLTRSFLWGSYKHNKVVTIVME